jgi:hypothetical protein
MLLPRSWPASGNVRGSRKVGLCVCVRQFIGDGNALCPDNGDRPRPRYFPVSYRSPN